MTKHIRHLFHARGWVDTFPTVEPDALEKQAFLNGVLGHNMGYQTGHRAGTNAVLPKPVLDLSVVTNTAEAGTKEIR